MDARHEASGGSPESPPPRTSEPSLSRRGLLVGSAMAALLAGLIGPDAAMAAPLVWGHPFRAYREKNYGYGPRSGSMHHGIDYPLLGTPRPDIVSVADGTVFDQGWHANFGNFAEIRHDNGWSSYYAHMLRPSALRTGQTVGRGDLVGVMGNSGAASVGDHLHIELRTRPGIWNATTDPEPYIHRALLPAQNPPPIEEDTMLALHITNGAASYKAILGPGVFRSLIANDDPDRVKNILRIQDDWQVITLQELPIYLRTFGCDLNIWDVRNGVFVVRDPLNGTVAPGNVWTATGEIRALISQL
jgi:hypothetical protein